MIALFIGRPCRADQITLAEAEKHAQAGDWEKARQVYQAEITASGNSAKLPGTFFFNYGTLLAKAGAPGEAYVALTRASFALPFDADTRHNLARVEQTVPASVRAVQPALWLNFWPRVLRIVPWEVWIVVALIFSALSLAMSTPNRIMMWPLMGMAFLFFLTGGLAMLQARLPVYGIVALAKVKSGPGKTFTDILTLEPGSLVNEDGERDGWRKIRFIKGNSEETVGWVEPTALLGVR